MEVRVKINQGKLNEMLQIPDRVMEMTMRQLLDYSLPTIPMDTGNLRRQSMMWGVMKDNKGYYIKSDTSYATKVWNMNDSKTNWTTMGTGNKWYEKMWKAKGDLFLHQAIERYKQ